MNQLLILMEKYNKGLITKEDLNEINKLIENAPKMSDASDRKLYIRYI